MCTLDWSTLKKWLEDSNLDARVSLGLSSVLSPTLTVYRNTSDDLYTFELSVKHGVDNEIADLCFHALYGNTDVTSSINEDYYGLGVIALQVCVGKFHARIVV